jgi:hypothetical protein
VLPFGRLWYGEPDAITNALGCAKFFSRSHDAVIRVYDESGNVIETREHAGDNVSPFRDATFTIRNLTLVAPWIIDCSTMSVITVKRVIKRAPKETSRIRRSFGGLARQFA